MLICSVTGVLKRKEGGLGKGAAFLTAFLTVALSSLLLSIALFLSGEHYEASAQIIFLSHIPVMFVDGIITAIIITFLRKTKPEILCGK